ncbi:MAG: M3 family oligoendopeptidase [Candidatus Bathyarchaeota archaeon]|nr:M3 family oligoendopeptidase [Candidatus Bathyarchaeota archaeon]
MSNPTTWNLTEIFPCISDPSIEQARQNVSALADAFEEKHRGKISTYTPAQLLWCLREFEVFKEKLQDLSLYAGLSFAADMTSPQTQTLHDWVGKLTAQLSQQLAFFSLELGKALSDNPNLPNQPELSAYQHMLERVLRRVPHQLSEVEEQLIIEKDQFGVDAWEELQGKWLNTRTFTVTVLGEQKQLSYGEANGLLSHPDRQTRESANRAIYGLLGKDGELFAAALRNICNDWVNTSKRRKYASPMQSSLISNDTEQNIIDNLLQTVETNAPIFQEYLQLKAKLLNLPVLGNHDINAPLPDALKQEFSFEDAQQLVTQAYQRFDEKYATAAIDMFEKRHIDVSPRFGKRNGAFCASWYRGKSAFILDNFTGSLGDVYTLAHELGHATHDYYAQRSQTPLNMGMPSVVAETASIFGELLLTDLLLSQATSDAQRRAVLCLVLDEAGQVIFQVCARVRFEQALYQSIKNAEYLDYSTICRHWTTARDNIFKDAVKWLPEMPAEWTMKPHYYMANYRYYNYPYIYAQLFVYALYEKYLQHGAALVPKLKKALSAGSSKSPKQIANHLDLDITAPTFWQQGINRFKTFTDQLKQTLP